MALCCSCVNSQGTLSQHPSHGTFFVSFFVFSPLRPMVKTTGISGPWFDCASFNLPHGCKLKFKKSPMGTMERCPGYWERDSSCHGYCSLPTCKGVNRAMLERLKKLMTVHIFNRSSQNGEFLCSPEDMIGRVGRICPYRWYSAVASPLQLIRILRDPYISRRSLETFTAQSHFAFPELSRLVCFCSSPSSSQAPLICFLSSLSLYPRFRF